MVTVASQFDRASTRLGFTKHPAVGNIDADDLTFRDTIPDGQPVLLEISVTETSNPEPQP